MGADKLGQRPRRFGIADQRHALDADVFAQQMQPDDIGSATQNE